MVKEFATGMHESWLYIPTTSTGLSISLIIFPLISNPFHLSPVLVLWSLYSTIVLLVFNLPLNEIARTQFFVRWMDCNTPLPEYVLSCVFSFFDRIFRFISCIWLISILNVIFKYFRFSIIFWIFPELKWISSKPVSASVADRFSDFYFTNHLEFPEESLDFSS